MDQKISVLIVGLILVSVVRSDEHLRCYMCTSLTNPGCDTDPKAYDIEPVECTLDRMVKWQDNIQQHSVLNSLPAIFDVDSSQQYLVAAPMACAKMILKVDKQEVTVRNCQTAKTEAIDPCKAIRGKVSTDNSNVLICELCMQDACNGSITNSPTFFLALLSALGATLVTSLYNSA